MSVKKITLEKLVSQENPWQEEGYLNILRAEKSEGRHIEWKLYHPFEKECTKRTKYRIVKALVSLANSDGGFVICGVDPNGTWKGTSDERIDASQIQELVSGCVAPDITQINFADQKIGKKRFIILHVPPSSFAPHMTTKDVNERNNGKAHSILRKYCVYSRVGAKSDICTPFQMQNIVSRRTEALRTEFLRRFKEVEVPRVRRGRSSEPSRVMKVTIAKAGETATPITITKERSLSSGILYHEEITEGVFEEINQVLKANYQIAPSKADFVFGESVYYRIYAERQHVEIKSENVELLLRTGTVRYYGSFLYWVLIADTGTLMDVLVDESVNPKNPNVYSIIRLYTIMGDEFLNLLYLNWQNKWKNHQQPPDYFKKVENLIRSKKKKGNRIYQAIASIGSPEKDIPDLEGGKISILDLSRNSEKSRQLLSKYCMKEFSESAHYRSYCRCLDFCSYGDEIQKMAPKLLEGLTSRF